MLTSKTNKMLLCLNDSNSFDIYAHIAYFTLPFESDLILLVNVLLKLIISGDHIFQF